jgi:hypothetical protein
VHSWPENQAALYCSRHLLLLLLLALRAAAACALTLLLLQLAALAAAAAVAVSLLLSQQHAVVAARLLLSSPFYAAKADRPQTCTAEEAAFTQRQAEVKCSKRKRT